MISLVITAVIARCSCPSAQVTLLHFSTLSAMVTAMNDTRCPALIDAATGVVKEAYGGLSDGKLHLIRQTLLRWLQEVRLVSSRGVVVDSPRQLMSYD